MSISTREKLFLGFLLIVTTVAVVGYVSIQRSQEDLQKSIGEESAILASELIEHIDKHIHRRIEVIEELSGSFITEQTVSESNKEFEELDNISAYIAEKDRQWTSAPPKEITPIMRELLENELSHDLKEKTGFYKGTHNHKIFKEVFVTNKYGVNVAQTEKSSNYYQGDERWWQEAKKEGLYVEDVEYDESTDVYSTDICVRIDDQAGNFSGVVKAVLNIEDTIDLIRNKEHKATKFKLLTKDHKIIYSTEDFKFLHELPVRQASRLQKGRESGYTFYFLTVGDKTGEKEELFAHAHSNGHEDYKGLGWILLVEHDTGEILVSSTRLRSILLLTLVVFIVTAVFVGLFISHSIHAPLKKLKNAMTKIGKGELDTRVEINSKDEIGFFADSFNKMAEDLKSTTTSVDKLNKEVCERKRVEGNLRTAKERAELLYSVVPSAIYTVDKDNCITSWNNKAAEITGYTADEVLSSKCTMFALSPCINVCSLFSDDVEKPIVAKECTIKRKDGRTATIIKNVDFLKDADGNIIGGIESFEDVTSRKKSEKAQRESEARYRTLYASSRDAIMMLAPPTWKFVAGNQATVELFGAQSEEEFITNGPWDVSPEYQPDGQLSAEKAKAMIGQAMQEGSNFFEWQHMKLDGEEFPATVLLARIELEGEQMLQATVRDITESKQAEAELDKYRHNLEKLVDERTSELKATQSQLVQNEKLAAIGQLAAGVAHEMNTPVGFVAGNFQILERHMKKILDLLTMHDELVGQAELLGNPQLRTMADGIGQFREEMKIDFVFKDIQRLFVESKEGVDRTVGIIQNLRDFSRIDQPGSRDKYDLNKGIEATLVVARNEIKYNADVKTDLSKLPLICCHSGQINQVFLNILINAAQAITSQERNNKGTITIRTYASDDGVVCEISDDGPGIPPDKVSKIFDPFFTTKSVGKGTGLGLSVSYDIIVNKHKGKLLVDSTVGEGTKFTIKLPIETKENDEEEEKEIMSYGKESSVICGR